MTLEEEFKLLVSGYYGVYEMDQYKSKAYVLKDIENYIKDFVNTYHFPYKPDLITEIENESLKTKLQDALLILNKVKAPLELTLMIRNRLNDMKNN